MIVIWVPGNRSDDNNNNVVRAYEILLPTLLWPAADCRPHRYETDFPREPSRARDRRCNESHCATHPPSPPPMDNLTRLLQLYTDRYKNVYRRRVNWRVARDTVDRAAASLGRVPPPSPPVFGFVSIFSNNKIFKFLRTCAHTHLHTYYYYNVTILHSYCYLWCSV